MDIAIMVLAVLIGLAIGALIGYVVRRLVVGRRYEAAKQEASGVLGEAREQKRALLLEAKEEGLKIRSAAESELRERRSELQSYERRLANREENADGRAANLERRENELTKKHQKTESLRTELEDLREQEVTRLEEIANLSVADAREELMRRTEDEIQHEVAVRYRDAEQRAREEANDKARNVLGEAIQRLASEVVSDITLTTVPLPSDDMKGRLIGREGRNIRAIEKNMGVDLIIDDTPEAVTLSCFDPIRREIARVAITKLIADGRIHPARIEEMVAKAEKEIGDTIWKAGEEAVFDTGISGLHPEIVKLLGRLKYRYSYGENVLTHSIEVGLLAGMLASEVGANVQTARTGGLLHDIGKALTHEIPGPHAEIGFDLTTRNGVGSLVCNCVLEHHDDDHTSIESFLVAAADGISAARPGARKESIEQYTRRLRELEDMAYSFDGVQRAFAIQAGREVRVMVSPLDVDDVACASLARNIAGKVSKDLQFPGQIKVTVIRETREESIAR
jgi:ribonuclease Y